MDLNSSEFIDKITDQFDVITLGRSINWIEMNSLRRIIDRQLKTGGHVIVIGTESVPIAEWSDELRSLHKEYGSQEGMDYSAKKLKLMNLKEISFLSKRRVVVYSLEDIFNISLSISAFYLKIREDEVKFKRTLEARLKPFSIVGGYPGMNESWAHIFRKD